MTIAEQGRFWPGRLARIGSSTVLVPLLILDLVFALTHVAVWLADQHEPLHHWLDIQRDRSIPEFFMYGKWAICVLACLFCFARDRSPLYLAWSALFAYFLLDDSFQIHEQFGALLVEALHLPPALLLRAQDFGELAASAGAGTILFGIMAAAYATAGAAQEPSKAFSRYQLGWVAVLLFFGVLVDMLHVQIRSLEIDTLTEMAGVLEDAGEMAAASVLMARCVWHALRLAAPERGHLEIRSEAGYGRRA